MEPGLPLGNISASLTKITHKLPFFIQIKTYQMYPGQQQFESHSHSFKPVSLASSVLLPANTNARVL